MIFEATDWVQIFRNWIGSCTWTISSAQNQSEVEKDNQLID